MGLWDLLLYGLRWISLSFLTKPLNLTMCGGFYLFLTNPPFNTFPLSLYPTPLLSGKPCVDGSTVIASDLPPPPAFLTVGILPPSPPFPFPYPLSLNPTLLPIAVKSCVGVLTASDSPLPFHYTDTSRKEMKCSGDSEMVHEIVCDTLRSRSCFSDFGVASQISQQEGMVLHSTVL